MNLIPALSKVPDLRKGQGKQYKIEELMMGGLSLFLFKEGSRNQLNNHREDGYFSAHYEQMFAMKLPHQDTVSDLISELDPKHLDEVKMNQMSQLFEQKWLRPYRLLGKWYLAAVDATGTVSFDQPHCEHCLTRTKDGKTTYFHYVLEVKLITSDGLVLSLGSEWIENPIGNFDKQDCERKDFIRLAAKLKKQYPRLPICLLADGLYPYEGAFKICEAYGWKYIFVLQENSLKTVQQELVLTKRRSSAAEYCTLKKGWRITDEYRFQTNIDYHQKYTIHWVQCLQTRKKITKPGSEEVPKTENSRFEYVTNIKPGKDNVHAIAVSGRLRWKIENEGFNTQKCGGYELSNKYSRKSYTALQNYYTLIQIAHAINQLVERSKHICERLKQRPKETIRNLWSNLKAFMIFVSPITDAVYSLPQNAETMNPPPG
ncbi:MAG: hypothetical protein LBC48_00030 [Dysgonamonadaceae bacterium]|nr:hypothetical protein [Dysgonamonadaceae bacterium]